MAKPTKQQPQVTGETSDISQEKKERIVHFIGDNYDPKTDTLKRAFVVEELRGVYRDIDTLVKASNLMYSHSGKTYSLSNEEKGKAKMAVFIKGRLNRVGYRLTGKPVDKED